MKRVGFVLKVKPEKIAEYKEHHRKVWPEMLDALRRTGWHNYSLFLRDDGLLILSTPNAGSWESLARPIASGGKGWV